MRLPLAALLSAAVVLSALPVSNPDRTASPVNEVLAADAPQLEDTARAQTLLEGVGSPFVPNLGQWDHPAQFVHRSGPMTVFLQERGWTLDLAERRARPERPHDRAAHKADDEPQTTRGVGLAMTFEGAAGAPELVGEQQLPGHHNYFLGNDERRWRTDVPLYGSVLYRDLYPGIDVRLRSADGVPEYDLLLQPGADLSRVTVQVEGGLGLSQARDGALVIETALGPLTQPVPMTWEITADGAQRAVACRFVQLGADRFGFTAPGWDGDTQLTIDPGLIWSSFLGGGGTDVARAMSVDAAGVITVAGQTQSINFPTSSGAYNTGQTSGTSAFVSQLDPSQTGAAQLVYSTYLGVDGTNIAYALDVDTNGVVTVAGDTTSGSFPTTAVAYSTTNAGNRDPFVSRLDPSLSGAAQLVYST